MQSPDEQPEAADPNVEGVVTEHFTGDQPGLTDERRAAIIRLLETLDDGLPLPVAAPLSTLGFVHRSPSRESCPDCLANGRAMFGCETCGGRGYTERRRSRDEYDTGANRGWLGAAKLEAAKERDREIDRLAAQVEPPRPEAELAAGTPPERWELERERLRKRFDYAPLAAALEDLRTVDESACRALHAVWVYGWLAQTSPRLEELLERGLRFVSVRLPDPLRAPEPPLARAAPPFFASVKERNRAIRKAEANDGATSQMLAQEHGLSVSQINRILAGEGDPS